MADWRPTFQRVWPNGSLRVHGPPRMTYCMICSRCHYYSATLIFITISPFNVSNLYIFASSISLQILPTDTTEPVSTNTQLNQSRPHRSTWCSRSIQPKLQRQVSGAQGTPVPEKARDLRLRVLTSRTLHAEPPDTSCNAALIANAASGLTSLY